MVTPDITVEPGDGSVIYYQPLAKETPTSTQKLKIGIRLDIKNNDSFAISVDESFITFPNDAKKYPLGRLIEFDSDLNLPLFFTIGGYQTKGLGMIGGSHNNKGQQIIKSITAPQEISITVKFKQYESPVIINRPLEAYTYSTRHKGYKFPGKSQDLLLGEYWRCPDSHWSGGNQIFAHDLSVIAWNSYSGKYDRIKSTSTSELKDYLVWEKPIYAMANGEVLSFENDIDDYQYPGTGFPDPADYQYKINGNGFVIRHGTDKVTYSHMKKGSLNNSLMHVPGDGTENVHEGDLLGLVGNSGNTSEPHLHILAVNNNSQRLRPFLFRDIQVISVDSLTDDSSSAWVPVDGQGLPATNTAIWPSTGPIPKIPSPDIGYQWEAFSRIIFGIIGGGGGLRVSLGYKPLPSPPSPPEPLGTIYSNKIDVLIGLAITELASIVSSDESKKTIKEAGIRVIEKGIAGMKKESITKENKDKE